MAETKKIRKVFKHIRMFSIGGGLQVSKQDLIRDAAKHIENGFGHFFEGHRPVKVPEGPKLSAEERIEVINKATTAEEVTKLLEGEKAVTVNAAGKAKLETLKQGSIL